MKKLDLSKPPKPIKLELIGRTLMIDGNPRQLSIDGGIYCPKCGNLINYRDTKYHLFNEHQTQTTNIIKKEANQWQKN